MTRLFDKSTGPCIYISQVLVRDEQSRGLELLETKNLTINLADFDPYKSEVTLNMKPTSEAWKGVVALIIEVCKLHSPR